MSLRFSEADRVQRDLGSALTRWTPAGHPEPDEDGFLATPGSCLLSRLGLRARERVARRAPGRASQGRARALTPGQRRCLRRRLDRSTKGLFGKARTARSSGSVDIAAVGDIHYGHHPYLIVDPVDHPVGATASAEPVVHWREQPLADPVGIGKQRACDELIGSRRNGFWETFTQGVTDRRRRPQLVGIFRRIAAHCARRRRIASASSSAETYSPRASSASDSAKRFIVAASRMISRVSSSASRSSGAIRMAEGLPCTVTVTRS